MDKIIIKNLNVFAYHGVNLEEKRDGQNFFLDVTLFLDLTVASTTDQLANTVNYAKVTKLIIQAMQEKTFDLIEAAAYYVLKKIFSCYPDVASIQLCLKKPNAPMKAEFEHVAVELFRDRRDIL